MRDYELETIKAIRKASPRLRACSNKKLHALYRHWSNATACAGWLTLDTLKLDDFIEWATIAPCDREDWE